MSDIIVEIDSREYEIEYLKNDPTGIIVNGKQYNVEKLKDLGDNVLSVSVNNKISQIEMEIDFEDISTIFIDGFAFEFRITNETQKLLRKYIQAARDALSDGVTEIKAHMPGLVVDILAEEGDQVEEGQSVAILEAMKMENALKAPVSGIVRNIQANGGKAVEKGALILEIHKE